MNTITEEENVYLNEIKQRKEEAERRVRFEEASLLDRFKNEMIVELTEASPEPTNKPVQTKQDTQTRLLKKLFKAGAEGPLVPASANKDHTRPVSLVHYSDSEGSE